MKKRLRDPKTAIIDTTIAQVCTGSSLIKHLASSKASIRSKAFTHVQNWLLTQTQIPDDDMKKLWKGLFYCLWHSDKAPAQALLIKRICSVVKFLDLSLFLHYYSTFLITLCREWNGIDHLRLDKFYLLIRMFIRAVLELLRKKYCWDLEVIGRCNEVLENNVFLVENKVLLGHGVGYHVVSVFLDELKGCFVPVRDDVVVCLFKPFLSVIGKSEDKIMVAKVKSCVFEELLKEGRSLLERRKRRGKVGGVERDGSESESYGDVVVGVIALKMGFSGKLFEVGSSVDCVQGNRKVVLKLHEEFLRLEKEFDASGIEFSLPEMNEEAVDDDGEEVPQLIPIENSLTGEVGDLEVAKDDNDDEALRKRKKVKREEDGGSKKAKKKEKKKKFSENDTPVEENGTNEFDSNKKGKKKKKLSENDTLVEENGTNELESNKKGKKKKKKNGLADNSSTLENISSGDIEENMITTNGDSSNYELVTENKLTFNEDMISNLQMQFEKVAAKVDSDDDNDSSHTPTISIISMKKKRKKGKIVEGMESSIPVVSGEGDVGTKSVEKSSKKVRFAMKNNLVWKPNSPMPSQDLRLPPTLTPRGSALKKGVPPGPIREMPSSTKKMKQKKKGRKILRTVSPAMKRLKRMKAMSA